MAVAAYVIDRPCIVVAWPLEQTRPILYMMGCYTDGDVSRLLEWLRRSPDVMERLHAALGVDPGEEPEFGSARFIRLEPGA